MSESWELLAELPRRDRGLRAGGARSRRSQRLHAQEHGDQAARRAARRASARTSPTTPRTTSILQAAGPVAAARGQLHAGLVLRAPRGPRRCSRRRRSARSRSSYRTWAYESAALDLALRQAGHDAARGARPRAAARALRRLAAPRRAADARRRSGAAWSSTRTLRFKLDPTSSWDEALDRRACRRPARWTRWTSRGSTRAPSSISRADPVLYERVGSAFPDAWIEDPELTPETDAAAGRAPRALLLGRADPLDRGHRGAALPAAHGQRQAFAPRRPAQPARRLRLLRRARDRQLRRRAVRARRRARARSSTWPRCSMPTRPTTSRRAASTCRGRPPGCRAARWRRRPRPSAFAGGRPRAGGRNFRRVGGSLRQSR